jgi:serine/threonine protein kinase/tetratricopeptide (TPR) repeat protein
MGQVYEALDIKLGRHVALKLLSSGLSGGTDKERLLQEARTASALDHPNIGTVHTIEETTDGLLYIVMARYEGETLQAKIRRAPLPASAAVDVAMQVARGLAAAHGKGIVHRDIKPSNIMVTPQGVKLLDFGLAKFHGDHSLTLTGTTMGTPSYMSPEQALRRPADHRSDIWSLGVVLYEMLTGHLPFHGDSAPAMLMSIATDPPSPMENVPSELETLIHGCLAKEPGERYQTSVALLDDLARLRVSGDTPTQTLVEDGGHLRQAREASSRPIGIRGPSQTPSLLRRRPALALASIAATLAVVAVAWLLWRARVPAPASTEKHVIVLPFTNVGNDPANLPICDGLLETLTSRLSSLEEPGRHLWVIPAAEVRRRKVEDPTQARQVLGANLVVAGSVQRDASGVRLTVNLIDTLSSPPRQIGSEVVDDRLGNFSVVQDKAVVTLAKLLKVELNPRAVGSGTGEYSAASAAYENYLKGVSYLQRYDKSGSLDAAVQSFETAVHDDPRFALAYARLAEALWMKDRLNHDPKLVERALRNCRLAQQINDQLAPVHVILGRIYSATGKYDLAIQEFQRALELDAHSAEAYQQVSRAYESAGRTALAEESLKKAVALRPDYWDGYNSLGVFYYRQHQYPKAAEALRRVLELTPDNSGAYSNLGLVLGRMGDRSGARQMYEKSISLNPTYAVYNNLAGLYYLDGDYAKAAGAYEKSLKLNDRDFRPWSGLASSYAASGDPAKSRAAYQKALQIAGAEAAQNPNSAETQGAVAYFCAQLGMREESSRRLGSALALAPEDPSILYRATLVYEALGQRANALQSLRAALARGFPKERVQNDPDLGSLRKDPAFQPLIK